MDPTTLPGMPAPFWFVQFFKVVGFTLHMIPMGLWFAGLPVAIGCALWNCKHSSRYARRMFGQFPVMMALGINFGIVPLLFLQTTYYKSFYTATILMGWHWLAVIPILIVGYYSLYLAAYSRRKILFGLIASVCLIAIGLLITNGLTLMVRSDLWPGIMERTGVYGATTGLANNMRDPAVWLRLATMFALGLMTTGVWAAFDSHFLMRDKKREINSNNEPGAVPPNPGTQSPAREDAIRDDTARDELSEYRRWTIWLASVFTTPMLFVFILLNNKIHHGGEAINAAYPTFTPLIFSVGITGILFSWFLFRLSTKKHVSPTMIAIATAVYLLTLAEFGTIRQLGQNAGVASYVDVAKIPTDVQWSPLIAFLVCFVLGLLVIAWMVRQCAMCGDDSTAITDRSSQTPNP